MKKILYCVSMTAYDGDHYIYLVDQDVWNWIEKGKTTPTIIKKYFDGLLRDHKYKLPLTDEMKKELDGFGFDPAFDDEKGVAEYVKKIGISGGSRENDRALACSFLHEEYFFDMKSYTKFIQKNHDITIADTFEGVVY